MEIGSIFDIPIQKLFQENLNNIQFPLEEHYTYKEKKFFNTGRSAIEFLFRYCIKEENYEVLVPNYICHSVLEAIKRANCEYNIYSITDNFDIDLQDLKSKMTSKTRVVLFLNYFGTAISEETAKQLRELKRKGIILVEDDTQSLFSNIKGRIGIGNYLIGSIRKWLPVPDGAVLYSEKKEIPLVLLSDGYNQYSSLYLIAQILKSEYLKAPELDKNVYLELVKKSMDSLFSDYEIRNMTPIAEKLLSNINIKELVNKRRENYTYLYNAFLMISEIELPIKLEENMTPFGMPILLEKREELFQYLIQNNIYCNIHWKDLEAEGVAKYISNRILTIPCDQRYTKNDMQYIVQKIIDFYKGK